MKITPKVLYQRVKKPLSEALHLDLSGLGIGAIESLELCPKLESLDLSRNCLEEIENFECCKNLWRMNFSDNKISCLGSLSKMFAVGTLDLSNNNLSWNELLRIRHVYVLDLRLYGNDTLENDAYYRLHVIDCLPNIWMLDGRLVTAAERIQVQQFFDDSALSNRPVRHKLNEKSYLCSRAAKSTEIYGSRTYVFSSTFPVNEPHNSDTDRRRLEFLAYNIEEDLKNKKKSMKRPSSWISDNSLQAIIKNRSEEKEKCNMLLLLLVASLEFDLTESLLESTLKITKLNPLFNISTMQLFQLDSASRTEVISLLVSSCKLDREVSKSMNGGLYDRLYLCLYHSVSHLLQKINRSKSKGWFNKSTKSSRPNTAVSHYRHVNEAKVLAQRHSAEWRSHQTLLASELILLLSVVPPFYQHILKRDPSIYHILQLATGDDQLHTKLSRWAEKLMSEGGDTNELHKELYKSVVKRFEQGIVVNTSSKNVSKSSQYSSQTNFILNTSDAYPKRPKSAVLTSGERLTHTRRYQKQAEFINMVKSYDLQHLTLGSFILLGPQNLAKVIALPEPHIALVQMELIPSTNGSVRVHAKDANEHYCYVDIRKLAYDHTGHYWKPRGAFGDKVTLQVDEDFLVTSVAEEEAIKRLSQSSPSKVMSRRAKSVSYVSKMQMQPVVRPISPTNSLIFISKEDELKSGRENTNSKLPRPSTQPLSSAYCEKMDLTLSNINLWCDSQYQLHLGDRSHKNTPEGSPRDSGLLTDLVGEFGSPDMKLSEQSGESCSSPRDEDGRWGLEGAFKNNVDTYLENQPRSTSYITEDSSFISEKPVAEELEDIRKLDDPVEKSPKCEEVQDGGSSVTPPESVSNHQQVEGELEEEVGDIEQHLDVELEEQCVNLDAEEVELEHRMEEEGEAKSFIQQEDKPKLDIPVGVESDNDGLSQIFKKVLDRNKFGVNGETVSLNERQREKKERVKSAPEEKTRQAASYEPPSRPASAIITPKKLLLHHKELVKDSRPGSASSFQMMRTEAWRSSASSASTGFPTSAIAAERFIQFVVDENQPKSPKVKFLVKSKRPPPQRPTSPDHYQANDSSQQSLYKSFSRPVNANDSRGYEPLPTSKWLAGGRNLHLEDVNTRQQLSADKLPGYLDGVYISSKFFKKKRYIPRANLGIDSLPSRPIKPAGMSPYTHRRNSANEQFASASSPQVHRLNSWSRPRFSNLGDIKRLSSPSQLGCPPKT